MCPHKVNTLHIISIHPRWCGCKQHVFTWRESYQAHTQLYPAYAQICCHNMKQCVVAVEKNSNRVNLLSGMISSRYRSIHTHSNGALLLVPVRVGVCCAGWCRRGVAGCCVSCFEHVCHDLRCACSGVPICATPDAYIDSSLVIHCTAQLDSLI